MKRVIVISGPTASGKTDLAIELAKKFGGEIVNFDSLLLYKEISIGTAKPTLAEQSGVPHHMIDVASISSPMNAADYSRAALPVIQKIHDEGKTVYLVGGSGFYLQAVLMGMYESITTPKDISEKSDTLYHSEGIKPFREFLKDKDPTSFDRYHENDHYRIRRAVEHYWTTNTPFSEARVKKDSEIKLSNIHNWDLLHIYLDPPKIDHQKIIEKRSLRMLQSGLIEEIRGLLAQGFKGNEKPLLSIGYKEVLDLLNGKYANESECLERIIISTRQLAKSQRTWFNRISGKHVFNPLTDFPLISDLVTSFNSTR